MKKEVTPPLFPEFAQTPKDRIIREDMTIAEYPVAVLRQPEDFTYTLQIGENRTWTLIGNPKVGLPEMHELDYLLAAQEILWEQTRFEHITIYFTIHELIVKAGKTKSKQEYKRAIQALRRFRYLGIQSEEFLVAVGNETKKWPLMEDISLIQYFAIVGGALKKGRKKSSSISADGYAVLTFTDYYVGNLRSELTSKTMNYTLRMKLSSPLCRRYFGLIDLWKHKELQVNTGPSVVVKKNIFDVAGKLTFSRKYRYPAQIRRTLDPMHKELISLQYLRDVNYVKENNLTYVVYSFTDLSTAQAVALDEMLRHKISSTVAKEFLRQYDAEFILNVIKYLRIKGQKDRRKLNPEYIVQTIRKADESFIADFVDKHLEEEKKKTMQEIAKRRETLRLLYDQEMESLIDSAIRTLSKDKLLKIQELARSQVIDPGLGHKWYEIGVDRKVREIIKSTVDFPTFEAWLSENEGRLPQ